MKTQLIILPDYNIIVSDETIEEDWKGLAFKKDAKRYVFTYFYLEMTENEWYKDAMKVLASDNPGHKLPGINYNGLEEELGIININKLVKEDCVGTYNIRIAQYYYEKGFRKAQELNTKKFSLKDMRKAFGFYAFASISQQPYNEKEEEEEFNKFIRSLQQPQVFDIEVELEYDSEDHPELVGNPKEEWSYPKITNNQIKITKILSI